MCETWIMVAFIGWMPPFRVDGFHSEEECKTTAERVLNYCEKSATAHCQGTYYCFPGPSVRC